MTQPAAPCPIEIVDIDLIGAAFSPHRHDTYTFALTRRGVQAFDYRGATRHSLPGEVVVLHPDEWHDGRAGDETGFGYIGVHVPPEVLGRHRPGGGLPFLAGGVSRNRALIEAVHGLIEADEEARDAAMIDLALALDAVCDAPEPVSPASLEAVALAAAHIRERLEDGVTLEALETLTGLSRWRLCRDFRTVLGASPYRYLTLRRLDAARREIAAGTPLAEAALAAGFADQAHMSRQFKQAFGLTPRRWAKARSAAGQGRTILQ